MKEKKPKIKKKGRWKRLLTYVATYLVVTFSVAFVVVSFSNKTYSSNIGTIEPKDPSALGMVVTKLMEMEDASVSLNASAENETTKLNVDANVKLKLYEGFTGAEVDVAATLTLNEMPINLQLVYDGKTAYASINEKNYSMKSNCLMAAVASVLNLCGVDIDLSANIMDSFDMSAMDSMADKLSEEKREDGTYLLTFAPNDNIALNIDVDKDYNITNVTLQKTTLAGFDMNALIKFNSVNSGLNIAAPNKEFVDVSEIIEIAKVVYNTVINKKFDIALNVEDTLINIKLDRTANLNASVSVNALDNDFSLTYLNNVVYLDTNILKIKSEVPKFDLNLVKSLVPFAGVNSSDSNVGEIVNTVLNVLNKIDLTKMAKTELGYTINVNDVVVDLIVTDNKISQIDLTINGKTYGVILGYDADIKVAEDEFTYVNNFEFLIEPLKRIVNEKHFSTTVEFSVNDVNISGTLNVDFENALLVEFKTSLYGVDVVLTITENGVYAKLDDVKIKLSYDNLKDIYNALNENTNSDLTETIKTILKNTIKFYKPNDSEINATYDEFNLDVKVNDGQFENLTIKNNKFTAALKFSTQAVSINTNFNDYEELNINGNTVKEIINFVEAKKFAVAGEIKLNDNIINYDINADLNGGIENAVVNASATVFNKSILVNVQNAKLYVSVDDIKVVAALNNLDEIKNLLSSVVGLSSFEKIPTISDINIYKVDNSLNIGAVVNGTSVMAKVDFADKSLSVNYGETNFNLNLVKSYKTNKLSSEQVGEYKATANDLAQVVSAAINTAKQNAINADVAIDINGKTYNVNVLYVKGEGVKFSTTYSDVDIWGYVANNTLYINAFDICFSIDLSDVNGYIDEIQKLFNLTLPSVDATNIAEIIQSLNLGEIKTEENLLKLIGTDYNGEISIISNKIGKIRANYKNYGINATLSYPNTHLEITNNRVIKLENLVEVGNALYNTFKNKTISGNINLTFDLFNETNTINVNYGIKMGNEPTDITAYIKTTFKGLDVNVYYVNNCFYLDVIGLKLKLQFNSIPELVDWVNNKFNTNINVDKLFKEFKLSDLSLNFITSAAFTNGCVNAVFNDTIYIEAEYTDVFKRITFTNGTTKAVINCTSFDSVVTNEINDADYLDYTAITNIVDSVANTINTRKFNLSAATNVYRDGKLYYNVDISLILNIIEQLNGENKTITLQAAGVANVSGEKNVKLNVNYLDKMLYLDYRGLKIKLSKDSIKEILGIVLSVAGVDVSNIPALDKIKQELDLNFDADNLQQVLPSMDNINPLNYLGYIKSASVKDDYISIVLNGEKLNGNGSFNPVVSINTAGGSISKISLEKLYTGVTETENISVEINLNNYASMPVIANKDKYIDISNSADLIKAFVNTSSLNDYHVKGGVIMSLKLGSLKIDAAELGVDVNVKLDANKKPIISIEIEKYPLIGGINSKNTNGVGSTGKLIKQRHRKISIYYRDGEILLKTCDEKWGVYKELSRVTRVTPNYLFSNIGTYMQWLLGFTDTIQDKINDAITTSQNNKKEADKAGTLDYSDVILNYAKNGSVHSFDVNIGKLAYNDQIGSLHIDLGIVNNSSTGGKDYLGTLNFNMDLLDSLIILSTNGSNKLELVDIGGSADVRNAVVNLNNSLFQLDGEYEKTGDGAWKMANQGDRTVEFYDGDRPVKSTTGAIGTALSFPTMETKIVDDGVTEKIYNFGGWFDANDTKYLSTAYPRYDTVLYAKWELVSDRKYATITFETNENISEESITRLEGELISLPVLSNIETQLDEFTSRLKVFKGWYVDKDFTTEFTSTEMPSESLTLYAKWEEIVTKTYSLTIYSAGKVVYSGKVQAGEVFTFPSNIYFSETTLYYTASDFNEQSKVCDFTINANTVWYAKNKYSVTLYSEFTTLNGGEYNASYELYENSTVSLPTYAGYSIDNVSYTTKYRFVGWKLEGSENVVNGSAVMPAADAKYVAVWEVKDYCVVSFNVSWSKPENWKDKNNKYLGKVERIGNAPAAIASIEVEKGTEIDISKYNTSVTYKYTCLGISDIYNFYVGTWNTTGATCAFKITTKDVYSYKKLTTVKIESNITYYPTWDAK